MNNLTARSILFVCLGNICRSPAAEGVMQTMLESEGLSSIISCDSCGTGAYHAGEHADPRMREHARKRGYDLKSVARQFSPDDFARFDLIVTMDNMNYGNIIQLAQTPEAKAKVRKFVSFCQLNHPGEVPDPYYGASGGFEEVMDIVEDGCQEILNYLRGN